MAGVQVEINDVLGHPNRWRYSWKAIVVQTDDADATHVRYIVEEGRADSHSSAAKASDEAGLRVQRAWDELTGRQAQREAVATSETDSG
jgi:hypothetical protein